MFEPVKRDVFEKHLRDAYDFGADLPLPLEQLALVFMVLALGVSFDLNAEVRDSRSAKYHSIAQSCLTSARFLNVPSLASIQCLHLMSTWQLVTHSQTGAFRSWPLLGLAGRMVLSTGIHRGKGSLLSLRQQQLDTISHARRSKHLVNRRAAFVYPQESLLGDRQLRPNAELDLR